MDYKQVESPLITGQIVVLALQTFPVGKTGPEAQVISLQCLIQIETFCEDGSFEALQTSQVMLVLY